MMMKSYRSWSFDGGFQQKFPPRLLKFQFGCGEKDIGWKKIAGICRGDGLFRGSGPAEYIVDRDAVLNIKTEAESSDSPAGPDPRPGPWPRGYAGRTEGRRQLLSFRRRLSDW